MKYVINAKERHLDDTETDVPVVINNDENHQGVVYAWSTEMNDWMVIGHLGTNERWLDEADVREECQDAVVLT